MSDQSTQPIGLFDSGIGGMTVLREVRRLLPGEDLLYLADQARCPYGSRSPDELRAIAAACAAWLIARGAKLVVVACNTASAAALADLRRHFPETPFIGMVPPVKPAASCTRSGVVGVLATPTTLAGDLLRDVIGRWAEGVRVIEQACPGLVEQIEEGALDAPVTTALLRRYITPLLDAGADTIVLGCTHYPLLSSQLRAIAGDDTLLIDAAPAVAQRVMHLLQERSLLRDVPTQQGVVTCATTADPERFADLINRLDLPCDRVEQADISIRE